MRLNCYLLSKIFTYLLCYYVLFIYCCVRNILETCNMQTETTKNNQINIVHEKHILFIVGQQFTKSCAMIIHHYLGLILYSEHKYIMTRFGSIQYKNGSQFLALKMSDFLENQLQTMFPTLTLLETLSIFANKILFFICFN